MTKGGGGEGGWGRKTKLLQAWSLLLDLPTSTCLTVQFSSSPSLSLFLIWGIFPASVVRVHTTASQYKVCSTTKLLKGFYVSFHRYVELEFHIRSWFSHCDWLVGLSRDEKREGGMAGPGFSRLEASFEDYFHWNKKVSGVWTGWACLWRTWEGRRGEKREPWVDSGEK